MAKEVAIVMAAGKGTRMKSDLPKVLVPLLGRPMIGYVIDALKEGGVARVVAVVGYRADDVREALRGQAGVEFALQEEQLGTGHAVMMCQDLLQDHQGPVLVVAGDAPMMQASTIQTLLTDFRRAPAACILGTIRSENPAGLGRILRDAEGQFVGIVEEKDATDEQRAITEVNMSYYVFDCQHLLAALAEIRADNAQREYYITDCPGVMAAKGLPVRALDVLEPCEALGVNTFEELATVEAAMRAAEHGE